jgi:transposase
MSLYPGSESDAPGRKFVQTGEFRAPRKGEFFLSGAIPEVYQAHNDLQTEYDIMQEAPIAPVLNLNGGAYEDHKRAYRALRASLKATMEAMKATAPHGRDFQTCEDSAAMMRKAVAEYSARLRSLEKIDADIYVMWQQLEEQQRQRRRS